MKSVIPVLVFYGMLLPLGHMLVYFEGNLIMLRGKRRQREKDVLLLKMESDSLIPAMKKQRKLPKAFFY